MAKRCLYCGLQLPEAAEFCPECNRPREAAVRVELAGKMRRATRAKGCLYCGLQLPESAEFCPECGRPRERSFEFRPIQESELDYPRKEMKGTDDLLRQGLSSDRSGLHAHPGTCPKCGAHLAERDRNTTGTLSTRKFSGFQSKQSMRSRVRRVRAASALRRRARRRSMAEQAIHP